MISKQATHCLFEIISHFHALLISLHKYFQRSAIFNRLLVKIRYSLLGDLQPFVSSYEPSSGKSYIMICKDTQMNPAKRDFAIFRYDKKCR